MKDKKKMKLYVWPEVFCEWEACGMAFAIAENKQDAVEQILKVVENPSWVVRRNLESYTALELDVDQEYANYHPGCY